MINGLLGHGDFSLANFRELGFWDLAARSASAAVFACLDWMYSEDDASATLEFREEVEELLPRRVFRIEQAHPASCFLAGDDFRPRLDPIAEQLASHFARAILIRELRRIRFALPESASL